MEEGGKTVEGTVQDVSAGGCFVRSDAGFDAGTLVVLSSVAPEGEAFAFGAKVVRAAAGGEPGMGLRFTDVGQAALRGIHQHLISGTRVRVSQADDEEAR